MPKTKAIDLKVLADPIIDHSAGGEHWVKVKVNRGHMSFVTVYQNKRVLMDTSIAGDKLIKGFDGKNISDGDHLFRVEREDKPLFDYLSAPGKAMPQIGKRKW